MIYDVIIIGAGASGCMAAITARERGAKTLIIERNEKIGKKLYITGKGRCNITNFSSPENHLNNIVRGKKFMNSAERIFTSDDTMKFFEDNGVTLKVERGNRVFPVSDKSSDIIRVFEKTLKNSGVEVVLNTKVLDVKKIDDFYNISCDNNIKYTTKCVIVATGGKSYSATGSDGMGYEIARKFGHTITQICPSLVPIILNENVKPIEGTTLKNVAASIKIDGKEYREFGEMIFTSNGVSGPIILTLSAYINRLNYVGAKLYIDLKPALDENKLDEKLVREFNENPHKKLSNYLKSLLPNSIVSYFLTKTRLEDKELSKILKNERKIILETLKRFDFSIKDLDNIDNAIVTCGGVSLDEINPKTMESKKSPRLYFTGEILDVDALTGGYNLQIALSTGFVAGNNCNWS